MTTLGNCCTRIYTMTFGRCFRPSSKKKLEEACNNVAVESLTNQRKGPINAKNRKMQPIHDSISRGERIRQASVRLYEENLAKEERDPNHTNNPSTKQTQDPRNRDVKTLSNYCSRVYRATLGRCFRACSKRNLKQDYENCLGNLKASMAPIETPPENPLVRRARELEENYKASEQGRQQAQNVNIDLGTAIFNNVEAMREGRQVYHISIKT